MLRQVFKICVALLAMAFAMPANAMQIFIVYGNGTWPAGASNVSVDGKMTLEVEPSDSFENVKAKIEDNSGLDMNYMKLLYAGVECPDNQTLADRNIQKESILHMVYTSPYPYTVRLAEGTEDAANWTVTPAEALTTGIIAGSTLTATYSGARKVKSVKAMEYVTPVNEVPLTLEALTAGTIQVTAPKPGMQYSINRGEKIAMDGNTTIDVHVGDKITFYGNGTSITSYNGTIIKDGTAQVKVYGNIMSLVDEEGFPTATTLTAVNAFRQLFYNNTNLVDASGLLLPATTLTDTCYQQMFHNCTNLTVAPAELPAAVLKPNCYAHMFRNTGLVTVPEDLMAAATTMAYQSCVSMFRQCPNLTNAPKIEATTMAKYCCNAMFYQCSSLIAAPALNATVLADSCYYNMFAHCTHLSSVTCLATNVNTTLHTINWLNNAGGSATGTKTFTADPNAEWPRTIGGIPDGWTRMNPDGTVWVDPLTVPMTIEALSAGTIVVTYATSGSLTMKYSKNGGAKQNITGTTTINVAAGDKVAFYGNGTSTQAYGNSPEVRITGGTATCRVYGNIHSLINESRFDTVTTLPATNTFQGLFRGNTTLTDASDLLLPATTLKSSCYFRMFYQCTSLEVAPVLPAPTLVSSCYRSMFYGCSKLRSVTCLATTGINSNNSTTEWLSGAGSSATGTKTFTAANSTVYWPSGKNGPNGMPSGWQRVNIQ